MANVFENVQITYEINKHDLSITTAADLNTSNVQKSQNTNQYQSQSLMLEICTALFMYLFKYMTVTHINYWTLGVFGVGPRCRPLASAGNVIDQSKLR